MNRWLLRGEPEADLGMTTQSMAVIEIRGHKYFSLMCRASDGNIWEHYYRIDGRRWRGWDWRNMSN